MPTGFSVSAAFFRLHSRTGRTFSGCGCTQPGYHCEVHRDAPWNADSRTDANCLFFGCGPDHTLRTNGILHTTITDTGRLAWIDGTRPPEVNLAHHRRTTRRAVRRRRRQ